MIILFGDEEAYLDRFRISARVRKFGNQNLGAEFYEREHSKPLFNKHSIINERNLYIIYHCINELFTILKFRTLMQMSTFELLKLSGRTVIQD